jgi:hypothetical protein
MAKPGRAGSQAAFAGVVAIDTLPAAAVPMKSRMTLLERFMTASLSFRDVLWDGSSFFAATAFD